jgi:hypothetical protein
MYPVNGAATNAPPLLSVKQVLPEVIAPGQPIIADVTVSNIGGRTADAVVITGWWTEGYDLTQESVGSQQLNGKRAWGMGSIAAGESRMVRLKLTPSPSFAGTSEFRSGFDATFSSAVSDTRSVKLQKPELAVTATAPEASFLGQPTTLQIVVKNPSSALLRNVNVIVRLPEGLRHESGNANLETDIATLAPGATETIPLQVMVVKSGTHSARVQVLGPGCEPNERDLKVMGIDPKVSVSLHGPKTLYQDWPATFEAVVENQSDSTITGATLEIKLPHGFRELRATDKPAYDPASHRLIWNLEPLKPGQKRTIVWFGIAKQSDDLISTSTISVGNVAIKRTEWVTKNAGPETR